MPKLLRKFLSSIVIAALVSTMFTVSIASAAGPGEGTATIQVGTGGTGADDATYLPLVAATSGTVTVGTLSYLKVQLTVGASHIATTENNVTIQIPTNLFSGGNTFDVNEEAALEDVDASGEFFISYTDTSGVTDNTSVPISFAASAAANTGLITIQADQQMDSTDIITVHAAVNDLNYVRAAQTVTISTDDTGADNLAAIAISPTVATTATDAATALIAVTNATVGGDHTVTTTLTVPFALDALDTIDITFPAFMDVSGVVDEVATGTFDDGGSVITCNAAAQVVTCAVSVTTTQTTGTIILENITSTYVGITDVTVFEVEDEGVAANDIATDSAVSLTNITTAEIVTANVEPQSLVTTAAPVNIISFTTINTIPSGGKIVVTYPAGFNVASANGRTAFGLSGLDGTWTATVSGQVITFAQSGGSLSAIGAKILKIEGITNPSATGASGTYTIQTQDTTAGVKDTITTVAADSFITGSGGGSSSSSSSSNNSSSTTTTTTTTTTTEDDDETTTTTATDDDVADTPLTDDSTDTEDTEDTDGVVEVVTEDGETVTINDISDHWADTTIEVMVEKGIVKGNPDGTFKPNDSLNRAEAAALIFRVLNMGEDMAGPEAKPFSDVELGLWYTIYIDTLKTLGVVKGNPDGTYKPAANINRAEFLTLAMNAYYHQMAEAMGTATTMTGFSDVAAGTWYTNVVYLALEMKFVMGTVCGESMCFNPGSEITRAEATQMLFNIFYKEVEVPAVADEAVVEEEVVEEVVEEVTT